MSKSQLLPSHICIEECHAQCCYETEMMLTKKDIHQLELIGFSKDEFIREVDGYMLLANKDNHCVFLDPITSICKVYKFRPTGCRFYPIILSLKENKVVIDSDFCTYGDLIPLENLKKLEKEVKNLILQIVNERVNNC